MKEIARDIRFVEELVCKGGPAPHEYAALAAWFGDVMRRYREGTCTDGHLARLWEAFGDAFTLKTLQGFVARKPHGYRGDYEIIERIYDHWTAKESHLMAWDLFFHQQAAPKAVRNRKAYFIERLNTFLALRGAAAGTIRVLDVGCGAARCVRDWIGQSNGRHARVAFDCVDHDPEAVMCAGDLCGPLGGNVHLRNENVFRLQLRGTYDFIWAAGLCDYFSDDAFVALLQKLRRGLGPAGRIILGNFCDRNPTRDYMEFGKWKLIYRTAEQLLSLGAKAGLSRQEMSVESESEGCNLFLVCDPVHG